MVYASVIRDILKKANYNEKLSILVIITSEEAKKDKKKGLVKILYMVNEMEEILKDSDIIADKEKTDILKISIRNLLECHKTLKGGNMNE